jgi:hypothetical protein
VVIEGKWHFLIIVWRFSRDSLRKRVTDIKRDTCAEKVVNLLCQLHDGKTVSRFTALISSQLKNQSLLTMIPLLTASYSIPFLPF